jgi:hypothetical protein
MSLVSDALLSDVHEFCQGPMFREDFSIIGPGPKGPFHPKTSRLRDVNRKLVRYSCFVEYMRIIISILPFRMLWFSDPAMSTVDGHHPNFVIRPVVRPNNLLSFKMSDLLQKLLHPFSMSVTRRRHGPTHHPYNHHIHHQY